MTAVIITQSQRSIDEAKAWDDVSSMMSQLVSSSTAKVDTLKREFRHGSDLIDGFGKEKESLHKEAEEITSSINAKIEHETNALQHESEELADQIRAVQALEEDVERETKLAAEIVEKRREVEQNILTYKAEAAEEVGAIDEIEMRRAKQIPRIRREFSMYAQMTNIKWDYSHVDALAGEVSLPHKFIHRRFSIEKDLPEFEIAEQIWSIIEG
ncbi:hypothetical protein HJC23_007181 [Cyclotella cryptica]|uniref:Kinetochore protein Spc24 n=1 Tax=Cyclotella cryptica TaxID=29204 RepID=A0ABD3QS16_9STRA|eukprot:CCRYP_003466-RA/>CCRYP_003466-RA protein AED:0.22 eAED:0.22 QI:0/-1/0/1/-1/1/1/0/212